MNLSAVLPQVIALANAVREYWERELPKRHPDYPLAKPGEKPLAAPPEEKKLADLLAQLPPDLIYRIGLIMYLGRGDIDSSDLPGYCEALKENFDNPSALASQMTYNAALGEYLQSGVDELKRSGFDLDDLPLAAANAQK